MVHVTKIDKYKLGKQLKVSREIGLDFQSKYYSRFVDYYTCIQKRKYQNIQRKQFHPAYVFHIHIKSIIDLCSIYQ